MTNSNKEKYREKALKQIEKTFESIKKITVGAPKADHPGVKVAKVFDIMPF